METSRKSDVAILILNYITWEETLKEAMLIHDLYQLQWEQFVIVDNASPNESDLKLREKKIGEYHYIQAGQNYGYAKGNNLGIRFAEQLGYKYVWIINNDILTNDGKLLEHMLYVFDKDTQVAAVNPDIYSENGYLYNRDAVKYSFFDMTLGIFSYKRKGRRTVDQGGYSYIYRPQGCCMLLDIHKTAECGYLDEKTFLYCEEMILAERYLRKGYKCACDIEHSIIHDHSYTTKKVFEKNRLLKMQLNSFSHYLREYRGYAKIRSFLCQMFFAIKFYATNK